jgi:excisionase family DNA binding protein
MKPSEATSHQVMTVAELAQYLQLHPSTVHRLLRERRIPAFKVGSNWRFNKEVIEKWLTAQEVKRKE